MLVITIVLILFFIAIYKRHQQMSTLKKCGIIGPKPNFIFGNLFDIAKETLNGVFPKWTKKYGQIVGFYIGGRPQVLITDFELIRNVLIKDFRTFSNKSQLIPGGIHPQPQLQKMLAWLEDNDWRHLRATLSPSFSSYKLNAMEPLMMESIENLLSELDSEAESGLEFNVKSHVYELMFSSAAKCIFGLNLSLNQISSVAKNFLEVTRPQLQTSILAMAMILFPSLSFIAHPLRVWWERFRFYMLWSPEGVCFDIAKKIVQVRKDAKECKSIDFLQLLMNARKIRTTIDMDLEMSSDDVKSDNNLSKKDAHSEKLSEEEIVSNAMLFLLASFETTAVTFQFVIHNLVNNQNIQDKLRNELKKAVQSGSNNIDFSAASKVPLLSHVIKETLRMFPTVSLFTTRVANENYQHQDILIPKGTSVFIGVNSIHNDPELWPQPEIFRPERFESDFDKLAYLPFGGG